MFSKTYVGEMLSVEEVYLRGKNFVGKNFRR